MAGTVVELAALSLAGRRMVRPGFGNPALEYISIEAEIGAAVDYAQ